MNFKQIVEDLTVEFIVQYNIEPTVVLIDKNSVYLFQKEIVRGLEGITDCIDLLGEDKGFEWMNKSIFVVDTDETHIAVGLYNEFYP